MVRFYFLLLLPLAIWPNLRAQAQQYPGFSQQLYDGSIFQPARLGLTGDAVRIRYRDQWVGMDRRYAPTTFLAGADLTRSIGLGNDRIGLGFELMGDRLFIQRSYFVNLSFAYHLIETENLTLSSGISAGLLSQRLDLNDTRIGDPFDLAVLEGQPSASGFAGGLGIYLQHRLSNGHRLEADLVLPQLFNSNLNFSEGLRYNPVPHLQLGVGYRLPVHAEIEVEPRLLLRGMMVEGGFQSSVDLGARAFAFDNRYWAGLGFRVPGGAFHLALGADLGRGLQLSALAETQSQLGFSFELGLRYTWGKAENPADSLAYPAAEAPVAPADSAASGLATDDRRDSLLLQFERGRQAALRSVRAVATASQAIDPRLARLENLLAVANTPATTAADRELVTTEVGRQLEDLVPELNQMALDANQADEAVTEADEAYAGLRELGAVPRGARSQLKIIRRYKKQALKRVKKLLQYYDKVEGNRQDLLRPK